MPPRFRNVGLEPSKLRVRDRGAQDAACSQCKRKKISRVRTFGRHTRGQYDAPDQHCGARRLRHQERSMRP